MIFGNAEVSNVLAGAHRKSTAFRVKAAWRIRPVRWIIYCGFIVCLAIATVGIYAISNLRENILAHTGRELQNVASVYAEHLEGTFEALSLTQLGFVQDVQSSDFQSADQFVARMSDAATHRDLKRRVINLLPVHALLLIDLQGNVINSSRDWPVEAHNVADADYFRELRSSTGPASFVGKPGQNPATREWEFYVAYTVLNHNGQLLGFILGVMRLSYFEKLFATSELGVGSSVSLVRRDGLLLARYPRTDMASSPSFGANELFKSVLPRNGKGLVHLKGVLDRRQERLIAGQNLGHHAAAVSVGLDYDVALAEWRKRAFELAGLAFLLLLVAGGMIVLCAREVGIHLSRQRFKLDTALNNMAHGLCMFDATGVLSVYNARYLELFNIPPGLVAPGMHLREMLMRLNQAGIMSGDQDQYVAELFESLATGKTTQSLRELKSGRIISIVNRALPEGGWVATHEDVTELKRSEDALKLENFKFNVALENMSQGLVMFDKDGKLIVSNRRYVELYGLPTDFVKPGVTLREILKERIARGIVAPKSPDQFLSDHLGNTKSKAAFDTTLELSDGRIIQISQRPLPTGGWISTHEDITARRRAESQIAHMAHHDALTNLPNRVLLRERLEQAVHHVRRGEQLAVLYLDLDHFKSVNDTLGHGIGDALLKTIADRLRDCVRDTDTIARLGGDEFAIIQTDLESPSDAALLATRIRETLRQAFDLDGHQVPTDVSIGISIAPNDSDDPDQLLKNADMALYRSKGDGRGTFRFFEPEMDERVKARRTLELDLRKAIVNEEFELYYQPLVNLKRDDISCCETLLRWHHPTRGMVPPAEFIPLAEETGLINQIGEWVLRRACLEAVTWPDNIAIAVNLSPVQFKNQSLGLIVVSALAESGLPAGRLELEITEAVLLQNSDATLSTLRQLKELGVHIAMDDFGTGYSSLSYLRSFPFDKIKIDRSFINDLGDKDDSSAIVQAVTELAIRLKMTTTAEGVETEEQLNRVQSLGCTEMQGYLFSHPLPAEQVKRLFISHSLKAAAN